MMHLRAKRKGVRLTFISYTSGCLKQLFEFFALYKKQVPDKFTALLTPMPNGIHLFLRQLNSQEIHTYHMGNHKFQTLLNLYIHEL